MVPFLFKNDGSRSPRRHGVSHGQSVLILCCCICVNIYSIYLTPAYLLSSQKALKATKNAGLQPALDWLEQHGDDTMQDEELDEPESSLVSEVQDAKSVKCDECGKVFRSTDSAQFHATKTGHSSFSESTDELKPLSDEEKKAKLEELKVKLAEKRARAAEEEKQEAKERERIRRLAGKDMSQVREQLKEKEMQAEVERKKREQNEEKLARERIKAQIEADKKDRAEKAERQRQARLGLSTAALPAVSSSTIISSSVQNASYAETRIQIRIAGSSPVVQAFPADENISALFTLLEKEGYRSGSYVLLMTYPRKEISPRDSGKSFKDLGLVPSASLTLQRQ